MIMSTNNAKQQKKSSDSRADKLKIYSIGSVVLLIGIILLVNVLFDGIFGKALTFDFSDSGQNSVSQESINYINTLPADAKIRVVGLFDKPEQVSDTQYQYIVPLLDDYVKNSNGRISVEYINPVTHPTIITQLDPSNSHDLASKSGCFVIEYNGKIKVVSPIDCYSYDEQYLYQGMYYVIGNNTEFTFTNAMYVLTQGYSCKAYVVTGLEEEGVEYITKIMDSMSIEVAELQVSDNFVIPEDCDILVLAGPNMDITEKMYVAMTDYISNGGKMFIAVNYSLKNVGENYVRLNKLTNQMNISIEPSLISENDPGYQRGGYTVDSVVTVADEFSSYSSIRLLHSTYARSIKAISNPNSGAKASPLLLTSNNASAVIVDQNGNAVAGSDVTGQFNVAMYAANEGADPAKMFVFGTLNFTADDYIGAYGLNDSNVDFFRSCIRELASSKTSNGLNIMTKSVDNYSLDKNMSTTSAATAMLVIFMIVIPVLLIALAVIVYTKRKNL